MAAQKKPSPTKKPVNFVESFSLGPSKGEWKAIAQDQTRVVFQDTESREEVTFLNFKSWPPTKRVLKMSEMVSKVRFSGDGLCALTTSALGPHGYRKNHLYLLEHPFGAGAPKSLPLTWGNQELDRIDEFGLWQGRVLLLDYANYDSSKPPKSVLSSRPAWAMESIQPLESIEEQPRKFQSYVGSSSVIHFPDGRAVLLWKERVYFDLEGPQLWPCLDTRFSSISNPIAVDDHVILSPYCPERGEAFILTLSPTQATPQTISSENVLAAVPGPDGWIIGIEPDDKKRSGMKLIRWKGEVRSIHLPRTVFSSRERLGFAIWSPALDSLISLVGQELLAWRWRDLAPE